MFFVFFAFYGVPGAPKILTLSPLGSMVVAVYILVRWRTPWEPSFRRMFGKEGKLSILGFYFLFSLNVYGLIKKKVS